MQAVGAGGAFVTCKGGGSFGGSHLVALAPSGRTPGLCTGGPVRTLALGARTDRWPGVWAALGEPQALS